MGTRQRDRSIFLLLQNREVLTRGAAHRLLIVQEVRGFMVKDLQVIITRRKE
jgi:hypothetical protein